MSRCREIGTWWVVAAGLFFCLVAGLGCDNQKEPPAPSDPKASLGKAAEAYWTARFINKDYKAAYEMELEKGTLPFEDYVEQVRNAGEIGYNSVRTDTVTIENAKGVVDLTVACRMPNAPIDMEFRLKDVWTLQSNQWKHVLPKKDGEVPISVVPFRPAR